MSAMDDYIECGEPHPVVVGVTCTQLCGHDYEHVSFDYPSAGQWLSS